MELKIDSTIELNDGHAIPRFGLGVWLISSGKSCESAVRAALDAGYRHIDTAAFYGNEESVGKAIRDSGIAREEIYVTTKLWNSDHGDPEQALERSLGKLKMDYVDLYLIHYPVPERLRSWRVLESLRASGKTRSIGVSNFTIRHLTELLAKSETVPGRQPGGVAPVFVSARIVGVLPQEPYRDRGLQPVDPWRAARRSQAGRDRAQVSNSGAMAMRVSPSQQVAAPAQIDGADSDPLGLAA